MEQYYGLLAGMGFTLSYASFGIFWGMFSEKANRKRMMVIACAIWSLISLISGTTNSFGVFVMMRMLLGIPQAALLPPVYSLL